MAIVLLPEMVLGVLTTHQEVISLGIELRFWLLPVLIVGSAAYIFDGLFLGLTAGQVLRRTMTLSALVGFLPLALFALQIGSLHLLWGALASFMVARVLTLGLAWIRT